MASSPSRKLPALFFLVVAAAAAFLAATAAQEYCGASLAGLSECQSFMYGGAAAPSTACCAAYEAAFDADPFCLCYVADGTYGRATGFDVDVDHALQIPAGCGQPQPPIELCSMDGLVLPPYAPQGTPAQPPSAAGPAAQPPTGSSGTPPSFTPLPPPPPPTSSAKRDALPELLVLLVGTAIVCSIV
ncbi:hypothetical protein BS78_K130900 [Paspalum vaginatum]|uniref:Bifunctional inhibitor/plant lipid transfer protein/seed storage helical domain-containing protein n=1 Tax=Paspalum vaginatum TaxID=158149 RepID=A0A9W7XBI7_9POAL|nr:hypothetical protein BS78_K130900 [Paspalum vaginatum]